MKRWLIRGLIFLNTCFGMQHTHIELTDTVIKNQEQLHDYFFNIFSKQFNAKDQSSFLVRVFCISATQKCCQEITRLYAHHKSPACIKTINVRSNELICQEMTAIAHKLRTYKKS